MHFYKCKGLSYPQVSAESNEFMHERKEEFFGLENPGGH
jgi:hypothetical protein